MQRFGDAAMGQEDVDTFLGDRVARARPSLRGAAPGGDEHAPPGAAEGPQAAVRQRDATLVGMTSRALAAREGSAAQAAAWADLAAYTAAVAGLDASVARVAARIMQGRTPAPRDPTRDAVTDDWACLRGMVEAWERGCALPLGADGLKHTRTFAVLCDVAGVSAAGVEEAAREECAGAAWVRQARGSAAWS